MRARGPLAILGWMATLGAAQPGDVITVAGWGPVRVGMTLEEATAATAVPLVPAEDIPASDDCHYRSVASAPGLFFMIEAGRVVRVDTRDSRYATPSGIRVGDSEGAARRVYARRAIIRSHPYSDTGHYLLVPTPDGTLAILIETDDRKVVGIRGGKRTAVEYIEGCL